MTYYYAGLSYSPNDLAHHGIKGQKWGVRRYENEDGTLTEEGKKRYAKLSKIEAQSNSRGRMYESRAKGLEARKIRKQASLLATLTGSNSPMALNKLDRLSARYNLRAEKAYRRGQRATRLLYKEFGEMKIAELRSNVR